VDYEGLKKVKKKLTARKEQRQKIKRIKEE
jgi:hypothetical protein